MSGQNTKNMSRISVNRKIAEWTSPSGSAFQKTPPERVQGTVLDIGIKTPARDSRGVQDPDPFSVFSVYSFRSRGKSGRMKGPIEKKGAGIDFFSFRSSAQAKDTRFGGRVLLIPSQIHQSGLSSSGKTVQKRGSGNLQCRRRQGFGETVQNENELCFHRPAFE
jgi:hypothetical protein